MSDDVYTPGPPERVSPDDPLVNGRKWLGALKLIDVMLTTQEGDNIPRGEAVKHRVRLLARQVVGWREPADTEAARAALVADLAQVLVRDGRPGVGVTPALAGDLAESVVAALTTMPLNQERES